MRKIPEAHVDVAIVGGGIQGICLARELAPHRSVAVVTGSLRISETLHSHGHILAGYHGNDLEKMKAYRKIAAYWRKTFDREGVPYRTSPHFYVPSEEEVVDCKRRWDEVGYAYLAADPPELFSEARWEGRCFEISEDLVFEPGRALARMREPLLERLIDGVADGFGHGPDGEITWVRCDTAGGAVRLRPRFVVLAAAAANAGIVGSLLGSTEPVVGCQAVRQLHMVCARSPDLPLFSGAFEDLGIVSHEVAGRRIWLLTFHDHPRDPLQGMIDPGVDPPISSEVLIATRTQLSAWMPDFESWARRCEWSVYAAWKAECARQGGQPLDHEVSHFDIPNVLVVWPSFWGNAARAAREVAEQINERLGAPDKRDFRASELGLPRISNKLASRWAGGSMGWTSWEAFQAEHFESKSRAFPNQCEV